MAQDTLTISDNRTNLTCNLSIEKETVRAMDLRQIKTGPEDFGLMTYDPANRRAGRSKSHRFAEHQRGWRKLPGSGQHPRRDIRQGRKDRLRYAQP